MAVRNKMDRYRERYAHNIRRYQDSPEDAVKDHVYGLLAAVVTLFAFWIRMIPEKNMDGLQALDPYMIARYAEAIVTKGNLPGLDVWRYVPYITPTWRMNLGDIFIPAYAYAVVEPLTGMDFLSWTQVYPAVAGALMVLVMYFIGKELFDRSTGVLAAFFLAAAPAVLHRSSAGWFEKEPIASLLMFTSVYFVIRAWKRKDWLSGIISGVVLAVAVTSWGGTRYFLFMYPAIAFVVAFLDEDIENILIAFTPTLLIGNLLAAVLNPARVGVPSPRLLAGVGVLALIWIRYIVEAYDVVDAAYYRYVVPVSTAAGAVLLFLSPLYSQRLAGMVNGIIGQVAQSGGDVVAGTVAENTPSRAGQIIGQLGVGRIQNAGELAGFYPIAEFFSGWTFAILGTSVLIVFVGYMVLRRFGVVEKVSSGTAYFAFMGTTLLFSAVMMWLLPGDSTQVFLAFVFPLTWAFAGGIFLFLFTPKQEMEMENQWYMILPLLWILSALFGATQRSRLLFLTSHPVSLMAGFGLSMALRQLYHSSVWEMVAERSTELEPRRVITVVIVIILIPVVVFNAGAAQSMASQIGGSPNGAWMDNLDFMREETPVDSVVLSWWDYGYWFQAIGGRASIADGGNLGFMPVHVDDGHKINYPLADFLTAQDYTNHMDWLQGLSVDYVVLDATMIGKYSAVSQIANRDNSQFSAMQTAGCNRVAVQTGNGPQRLCRASQGQNGNVFLSYSTRGAQFLVPINPDAVRQAQTRNGQRALVVVPQQGGLSVTGQPMLRQRGGAAPVQNFCTAQNGIQEFDTNNSQQSVPGCVAFHPHRQHRQLVYIPEDVMGSTLVNLYIMNAHNMPEFEEVHSNGYVKMWKVNYPDDTAS